MSGERLTLTIDGVVVDGLAADEARRFGASLEHELGALLEERGVPAGLTASAELAAADLGDLDLPATAHPELLGRAVAGRVYERLQHSLLEDHGGAS